MSEIERIRAFLRSVRRRALLASGLRAGGLTLAGVLAALLVLALGAVQIGPAAFWPTVTTLVLILLTGVGVALGAVVPRRRFRSPRAVAALVGKRHPPLASDLISAVELDVPADQPTPHGGSPALAQAFHATVAASVAALDPRRLVPLRPAAHAGLAAAGALVLFAAALALGPAARRGLDLLTRHPTRFEGAAIAREPLIGDVKLTYAYPAYTGLPSRIVEGSTGDIVALKGTKVSLEAKVLRRATEALILLGERGEKGELPVRLDGEKLEATFALDESGSYRVWLAPFLGRPVREERSHRLVVEADRPPEVEIIGPADRLQLEAPRPIEVAYSARDDFGLDMVDLVYRVDDGPEERIPLKQPAGARAAQGKTVFEPGSASLVPGARVAYRVEARDRDAVSGAKSGSSRTLYVIIQNPRESLDEQLAREKEILDRLLEVLADRLEMNEPGARTVDSLELLARWAAVHEAEEAHVALLGRVIDDMRRSASAGKALAAALAGIGDRLGRQLRDESKLLAAVRARADEGALASGHFSRLQAAAPRHIQELEQAVLQLDDLIGRQRLEDLASLGRDLTAAFKRLQDLLERYNATKDEALRRQLEREIRDLRARIEELARKIAETRARNEVSTEWQNMPDMREALEKVNRLDSLLERGDPKSLEQALAELGRSLESLREMLDKNAGDFGNERFAQENKAVAEAMKKLGDLEGDQRGVAGDSQKLAAEVDAEMTRRMEAQMKEFLAKAKEKLEAFRKKAAAPTPRELGEAGAEEQQRAQEAGKQLWRLLPAQEWAEAKKELEKAQSAARRANKAAEERAASRPSEALEAFAGEMAEAGRLAQELAQDLDRMMPRPQEAMSPGQRQQTQDLAGRQRSIEERARQLADEMARRGSQMPDERAEGELRSIGEQMGQAGQEFDRGVPREGHGKAEEAADRLAKLRDSMGQRPMGSGRHREPVRIPGADESKAPREWRQELLEAMRGKAPERFREEVRRYYEELVK